MGEIVWTEKASSSLESIHNYISQDSITYASRFVKNIINQADILNTLPLTGRIVPEFNNKNIREIIYREYRIVYRVENNNNISILTVFQGNKEIENLIKNSSNL